MQVFGATASGEARSWTFDEVLAMPKQTVRAELRCASGTSTIGHTFFGVPARLLLDAPPAEGVCLVVPHLYGWTKSSRATNKRRHNLQTAWGCRCG